MENEISGLALTSKRLQEKIQTERDQALKTEGEYDGLVKERSQLQQQIDGLKQRIRELRQSINAFEGELARLSLDSTVLIEEVEATILRNEALLSEAEPIKGELLRFELALDEVQLSARLFAIETGN